MTEFDPTQHRDPKEQFDPQKPLEPLDSRQLKRQHSYKNWALFTALLLFCLVIYFISIFRMKNGG
ncbi:MAG: hypothetical protein K1X44_06240 [Alphaproteobacteria bacterium]|nr:hypothetical protein [Alphaproteobacteria bacterium]